ncbi:MAG: glycosyltransferase family 4 protein [Candidatus Omnitrophica bacterium]|nr:glycosyltransferase family 4 protein [Candidatus Omnitrophota bacterium]
MIPELLKRGHQVTLFAHPNSKIACNLIPYSGKSSVSLVDTWKNMQCIKKAYFAKKFDVLHSFGRLAYLLPLLSKPFPKIMTYQRKISPRSILWGSRLSRGSLHFTAISHHMVEPVKKLSDWKVIYNAVDIRTFQFQAQVDSQAPLIFLGRVEEIKGPHLAIEVAQKSGRRLLIAGNIPQGSKHQNYFETRIKPHLMPRFIDYIGPVEDAQKNELLRQAAALLMPILWEEPFGIVMAEALACGTPVIGLRQGSVPEVILQGQNGFVCDSVGEMIVAVAKIGQISRAKCREDAEKRFSHSVLVDQYENLYQSALKK